MDRKSDTVIKYNCMYLKFSKESKRFSSNLTTDVVIAFRMTAKLFSFRKEVLNRWIIIRNGTTRLVWCPVDIRQLRNAYNKAILCY